MFWTPPKAPDLWLERTNLQSLVGLRWTVPSVKVFLGVVKAKISV